MTHPQQPRRFTMRARTLALTLALAATPLAATAAPQDSFDSAEAAATALVTALQAHDAAKLRTLLGPGAEPLINSGDKIEDERARKQFLDAYAAKHTLAPAPAPAPAGSMRLVVGDNQWPLPIPIAQVAGKWQFDATQGAREIIDRRIGRNEVAAIRVSLVYVAAQKTYLASTGTYAQRLVSTPGATHDGLYWPAAPGQPPSPLAPLVDQAIEEGYPGERVSGKPVPYQGYHFRILTKQGPDAPGGPVDYISNAKMTRGFALLAWPATYGASGIMTFTVNQNGVVFQKDLGPTTAQRAQAMTRFDPDPTWAELAIDETK